MKIGAFYSQDDIRCEEAPVPKIGSNDILVKMRVSGICGSDLRPEYIPDKIRERRKTPVIIGHEVSGEIAEAGNEVTKFKVGDRVVPHHHVGCLSCWYCNHGAYTLCDDFYPINIEPGGFAEFFKVPARLVAKDTHIIPDDITFEEAAQIEPVACIIRGILKTPLIPGDAVAVVGCGPMGLTHIKLLKIMGAGKIIATDLSDYRLKAAKKFGATLTINPQNGDPVKMAKNMTDGRGVDIAYTATTSAKANEQAVKMLRRGGTLSLYASVYDDFKMTLYEMNEICPEITITRTYSASHLETKMALELMKSKRLQLDDLITHRFRLDDIAEAFKVAYARKDSLKTAIVND
jgi:L-iditol 2-dehydrogenase